MLSIRAMLRFEQALTTELASPQVSMVLVLSEWVKTLNDASVR
jgi:hypothetical protein